MSKVIDFEQHRRREVVEALKSLLAAAEEGRIHGLAYVAKVSPSDSRAGLIGDYRRCPEDGLDAAFALERHLCNAEPFASSR